MRTFHHMRLFKPEENVFWLDTTKPAVDERVCSTSIITHWYIDSFNNIGVGFSCGMQYVHNTALLPIWGCSHGFRDFVVVYECDQFDDWASLIVFGLESSSFHIYVLFLLSERQHPFLSPTSQAPFVYLDTVATSPQPASFLGVAGRRRKARLWRSRTCYAWPWPHMLWLW